MNDNYNILIDKLDAFIRKYYTNQLIRGGLYSIALLGSFFLIFTQLESLAWFSVPVRTILFYFYLLGTLIILFRFVFLPLLKLNKAGKRITHEMAAGIIGQHFKEVSDVLLNTLQLNSLAAETNQQKELILASINQKAEKLKPVPFTTAIDLSKNRKYLYYALPPVLILLLFLLFSPKAITGPGSRLINHSMAFEKPLPFSINVTNKELKAVQQEDFILNVDVEGEEIPDQVFIVIDGNEYRMDASDKLNYSYTFKKVQKNQRFKFQAVGHYTTSYELVVLPKPIILNFDLELNFPAYTGKKSEVISNTGDVAVPQGTNVLWKFYTRDTRFVTFKTAKNLQKIKVENSNTITTSARLMEPTPYSVSIENQYMKGADSMSFFINVIPDLYPLISVEEYRDSVYDNRLYFRGLIKDDYGFKNMDFRLSRKTTDGENSAELSVPVIIQKDNTQQQFYHFYDVTEAGLQPGDEIEYYFIVWDNDGVNGSKSSRSQKMALKIPTREEIEEMVKNNQDNVKSELEKSIAEAQKIQKDINQLNKKLIDKKSLNYQEKKQVQDLLERQQNLQKQVEEMRQENEKANIRESQYSEVDESIAEKQKQLEKLFEEIMNDDLKKLFDELRKMMENLDKDKLNEVLDKMKFSAEDMEKALDRNLELFKQLEFDKKLTDAIEKLKELSDEQKKLSEKTENADKKEQEKLSEEQEKINKEFENLKKDLQDLKEMNDKLEEPNNFKIPEQKKDDIQKDLDDSKKNLKEGQMKKASKSQDDASDKMEEMSDELFEMQQEMEEEELGEDIEALRAILENLVQISFDQEGLIDRLATMNRNDPQFTKVVDQQNALKDNLVMVEDSLYALSKRQAMIEPFVNREISAINDNVDQVMVALNNRVIPTARGKQQFVMTSVNNLALMLAESMKKMQQSMSAKSSSKSGKSCPNPGMGKPSSMKSMRQMQEKLNKQMEAIKKGMKEGKGEKGKTGQGSMSEQLARMAAEQSALRNQLQEYRDQLQKEGSLNQKGLNKMIEEMDKTETELVNKILNQETMRRQEEILTRMLESEKAEMQREQEERRESNQGRDLPKPDPASFFNNMGIPSSETELLRTVPPSFKLYYKNKVNEYFINIPSVN
ncbi:MAG: DUF4175 family protein [Lentimicrobium sp.]